MEREGIPAEFMVPNADSDRINRIPLTPSHKCKRAEDTGTEPATTESQRIAWLAILTLNEYALSGNRQESGDKCWLDLTTVDKELQQLIRAWSNPGEFQHEAIAAVVGNLKS